jgi:hypothetical protein
MPIHLHEVPWSVTIEISNSRGKGSPPAATPPSRSTAPAPRAPAESGPSRIARAQCGSRAACRRHIAQCYGAARRHERDALGHLPFRLRSRESFETADASSPMILKAREFMAILWQRIIDGVSTFLGNGLMNGLRLKQSHLLILEFFWRRNMAWRHG